MKVSEIFKRCENLTNSKRQDYTSNPTGDPHENFKRSAIVGFWFSHPDDKPYAILIGTKIARLATLLTTKRFEDANHESIEDTFLDLINYFALWAERYTESKIVVSQTRLK